MEERKCSACKYFRQHYCINERKLFSVYCGHCTFSAVKRQLPDAKACENFDSGKPAVEAFVTKEYLSKALLNYILSMELLPEIEKLKEL